MPLENSEYPLALEAEVLGGALLHNTTEEVPVVTAVPCCVQPFPLCPASLLLCFAFSL